jgi:staphylococcal nuclease domain-containing protein 1
MEKLRAAERTAKERRLCLYANVPVSGSGAKANGSSASAPGEGRSFEGTVIRVWSGDQISVVAKDGGKERRLQLSSTRAPR